MLRQNSNTLAMSAGGPRTSEDAAKLVTRNKWEPRPSNYKSNHRIPNKELLKKWRSRSDMPYKKYVNGRFKGTTDEIIQWAAHKWGDTNLMRSVATVESWWRMDTKGDNGDSFGLYQVRRPYHCWGKCSIARYYTAWNTDYYGGIIRAYYDGKMTWLNTVERGKQYRPGDLFGSFGAWYSGRWWTEDVSWYTNWVKYRYKEKTWKKDSFVYK